MFELIFRFILFCEGTLDKLLLDLRNSFSLNFALKVWCFFLFFFFFF